MPEPFDIGDTSATSFMIEYNPRTGVVAQGFDGTMRELVNVRMEMTDRILQDAAAEELRKLGYTVIPPGDDPTETTLPSLVSERGELIAYLQGRRRETLRVLRQSVEANSDYYRWQGHAEMSRQLLQRLGAEVPQ
jgi:hypothetical protein